MMMALVVVTVFVAVLMAGVPSATAESAWILGDEGEACNSVCARNSKSCNADHQSLVTSEVLFKEKLSMAGYESGEVLNEAGDKRCQYVTSRRYAGAPFVADGGKTCVFLTPGRKSVCKRPWVRSHKPLCYCEDTTPDPCAGFQCGDNAVCVSPDGTPKCVCLPGLIGDPDVICDYDDCKHEPCSNGGTCVDDIGSYSCLCPDGYVGNDCEIKNTTPVPTTATGNTTPVPTTATESEDCTVAEVGSSSTNPKTVTIASGVKCPTLVDKSNWLDGHTWPDTFSVHQNETEVTVTRTDEPHGWRMNLRFTCCAERLDEDVCKNTDFRAKSNDPGSTEIALKDKEGNGCSWYEKKPKYCGSYDTKEFQANTMCCVCKAGARETCTDTDNGEKDKSGRGCSEYQRSWCGTLDTDTFNSWEMCCACNGEEDTKQDEEQKTGQGD